MKRVLCGAVGLLLVYTVLPMILTRVFGWRVLKKGVGPSNIAITFDDGPDPEYTPYLLDVLKRHGVRATFFVIGAKAAQYPELILRMQEEGHQIGIHGYVHQCNWLLLPWMVRHHVERTAEIIAGITGERPRLYRPTWGLLNVFNLFTLRDYDIVLWSVMVGDWRTRVAKSLLQDRLLKRMSGGDVVVLHDSGATFGADADAPKFMMQALDAVLQKVRHHGYQWITVGEMMKAREQSKVQMSWQKRLLVAVWMKYELLFQKAFRIRTFDESNPVLHYRVRKYSGPTLTMSDGTELHRGDKIAELHFDNALLFQMNTSARSSMKLAIQMIRGVETLLPVIARHFAYNPEFEDVVGLYGITMINRGVKQLGFSVEELPRGAFAFFTQLYLRFLVSVLHPAGKHGLDERVRQPEPRTLLFARSELMRRYPVLPVTPSTKREIASNELDEMHEEINDLNELILPHS